MLVRTAFALALLLSMNSSWALKPENTAIFVVEFQNQWTEPGLYNRMIKEQYDSRNVYENTVRLLSAARDRNFPVVQAPLVIDPKNKQGWFAWLTFGRFFTKGSRRAEFTNGIVQDTDIIVQGRAGFDGFVGSDLAEKLKETGAKNLLFCGFTTEHCVDMTMETALKKHGFDVWLIPDCTATKNARLQNKVEQKWSARNRLLTLENALDEIATKRSE
ncbi:MAG: isochorismatase family cysteine hydrolase [Pseudomonadales bacterium]